MLKCEGLTKRFGGLTALADINLEINDNERLVGMIGPNGAGKTTLFRLLAGVHAPSAGRVVYNGHDVTHLPTYRRARLGLVMTHQIVRPFGHLTALDNVAVAAMALGKSPAKAASVAAKWLEYVGFAPTEMKAAPDALPLFMLKKLELARALALEPKMLLLDEIMSGLRPSEHEEAVRMLQTIPGDLGCTIVIIEHLMSIVMRVCERVIVLNYGTVLIDGVPAEVRAHPEVIEAYLGKGFANVKRQRA